jgi:hypothetical protein
MVDKLLTRARFTRIDLPAAVELVAAMDAGASSKSLAAEYGCSTTIIMQTIRDSGILEKRRADSLREAFRRMLAERDDLSWMDDAACREHDPTLWFPKADDAGQADAAIAKRICASCPVRAQCAAYGKDEQWGIWSGVNHGRGAAREKAQDVA